MAVSTHVSGDGTVYLRTHEGHSSREIAESLVPYIGRTMRGDLANNYGHYNRYRLTLKGVSGDQVTVEVFASGRTHVVEADAFSTFGSACTMIDPEK
jgi:hypothetical protein